MCVGTVSSLCTVSPVDQGHAFACAIVTTQSAFVSRPLSQIMQSLEVKYISLLSVLNAFEIHVYRLHGLLLKDIFTPFYPLEMVTNAGR